VPANTNKCVAAIAYMKSKDERKSRRPIQSLLKSLGNLLE